MATLHYTIGGLEIIATRSAKDIPEKAEYRKKDKDCKSSLYPGNVEPESYIHISLFFIES